MGRYLQFFSLQRLRPSYLESWALKGAGGEVESQLPRKLGLGSRPQNWDWGRAPALGQGGWVSPQNLCWKLEGLELKQNWTQSLLWFASKVRGLHWGGFPRISCWCHMWDQRWTLRPWWALGKMLLLEAVWLLRAMTQEILPLWSTDPQLMWTCVSWAQRISVLVATKIFWLEGRRTIIIQFEFANWCDFQRYHHVVTHTRLCLLLLVSTRLGHWGKAETVEADGSQTWVPSVLALILSAVLQVWSSFSLLTEKLSFEAFIWPTMNCTMLYMSKLPKTDHFAFGHMNARRIFFAWLLNSLDFFSGGRSKFNLPTQGLQRLVQDFVRHCKGQSEQNPPDCTCLRPWVAQTKFRVGRRRVVKTVTQGSQWFVMAACLPRTVLLGLVSFFGQDCMSGTCVLCGVFSLLAKRVLWQALVE